MSESIPYFSENHRDNSSSASTDATAMDDGPLPVFRLLKKEVFHYHRQLLPEDRPIYTLTILD